MNNLFGLQSMPLDLVTKCIWNNNFKKTIKNAVLWSRISTVFYKAIESKEFFEGMLSLVGTADFWPRINQTKELNLKQFCKLRNHCLSDTKEFPGVSFGDAWVDEEGVEVFSFFKGLGHFKLKENSEFNAIAFPENMPLNFGNFFLSPPSIARSKDYLAVDGADSCVHVYKSDSKQYLTSYKLPCEINQIAIQANRLYVVEKNDGPCRLFVLDLEQGKELNRVRLENYQSSTPICFGKDYLIYSSKLVIGNGTLALSLSDLQTKLHDAPPIECVRYFFPIENGFIAVNFKELFVCEILKISFEDDRMKKTMLKEELKISEFFSGLRTDVCFHDDRLIVAYRDGGVGIKLFSYDLLLEKLIELPSIPSTQLEKEPSFKPRFLCMAENIHYLYMRSIDEYSYKSNLSTFTFSKI